MTETYIKYDRFSKIYDLVERRMERKSFAKWRKMMWEIIPSNADILEVGVGTGKNIPYYPDGSNITAIDFSEGMLDKAILRANEYSKNNIKILKMDVTDLKFQDNQFDFVVSTFVFCTVPDPIAGLREVRRVLKPDGKAIFLEHMRSSRWFNNIPLYIMNPVIKAIIGTSVIRKTKENILKAGFKIVEERHLFSDIVRLLICKR